jgi:hypothetical protein
MAELQVLMRESPFRFERYGEQIYKLVGG